MNKTLPKRPRDPNQLAKSIIDIATGQKPETSKERKRPIKDASKSKIAARSQAPAKKA